MISSQWIASHSIDGGELQFMTSRAFWGWSLYFQPSSSASQKSTLGCIPLHVLQSKDGTADPSHPKWMPKTPSSLFMVAKLACHQITAGAPAWASSDLKTEVKGILCWICAVGRTENSSCSLRLTQTGCVWFDTNSTAQSHPFTFQWRMRSVLHPNMFLNLAENSKEVCIN